MKCKDIGLYKGIKTYNDDYLPKLRSASTNTIKSYKKTIELFLDYLNDIKKIKYKDIQSSDFNDNNICCFLKYLEEDKSNSNKTINI